MLSFKDFTNEVLEKLKERLGYKYDFQVTEVEKNNNVKKIAIVAGMYEESSSIVIYIEGYYEEYINGVCIEQIVYSMSAFIQSNHIEIDVEEIKDYEQIKDRLFFRLINYKANKASLRNVPHIRYFDLSIVFCLSFKGDGYMTVTTEYAGIRPVIELHTAGLKVGQAMVEGLRKYGNAEQAKQYALTHSPAMAFAS